MSSDGAAPAADFLELWPTVFVKRLVTDCEAPNRALLELVRGLERKHRGLTTDYRAPDLFNRDEPAVAWLRDAVNETVIGYLGRIGMDYPIDWTI